MKEPRKIKPLLAVGCFGVHLICSSGSNKWSFVGNVPVGIRQHGYGSEDEGIDAFVAWFKNESEADREEWIPGLRPDVLKRIRPWSWRLFSAEG